MPSIEFGSLKAANETRSKVEQHLSRTDKRNEKTVRLKRGTPDRILERVKESAFGSREQRTKSAGKAELSKKERDTLKRTTNFNWQQHGFQAMAVKGALKAKGVDTWTDYYEPGEGVSSALAKLRDAKGGAQSNRASIGVEGMRHDEAEVGNTGRRSRQTERANAQRAKSAKEPAIVNQDTDAIEFLREEQQFGGDPFDITTDTSGLNMSASGADMQLVEERNQKRSDKARRMDDLRAAEVTTDPLTWSQNPAQYDFPGVDTLEPEKVHETRSLHAQAVDEREKAPIAESREQWAAEPDEYDWPGVDTPNSDGVESMDMPMADTRAQQDTLGFAADPTEARESRTAVEESSGGILEDTRESVGRGPETNDTDPGEQAGLSDMDAAMNAMDEINDDVDETMGDIDNF